jgi:hypothetical protein
MMLYALSQQRGAEGTTRMCVTVVEPRLCCRRRLHFANASSYHDSMLILVFFNLNLFSRRLSITMNARVTWAALIKTTLLLARAS